MVTALLRQNTVQQYWIMEVEGPVADYNLGRPVGIRMKLVSDSPTKISLN